MADGTVGIEARLLLQKLQADIRAAAQMMKSGLSAGAQGTAKETEKSATAMDKFTTATRRATNALKEKRQAELAAWRASIPTPNIFMPGQGPRQNIGPYDSKFDPNKPWSAGFSGGSLAGGIPRARSNPFMMDPEWLQSQAHKNAKAMGPLFTPPPIPQTQRSLLPGLIGQSILLGGVLASVRVALGYMRFAVDALLAPMKGLAAMMKSSVESGRRTYTNAVMSGTGLGFGAHRESIARVIGVGVQDIYQFGSAVANLSKQLREASIANARTAQDLAALSFQTGVLKENINALQNQFSAGLAPVLKDIATVVSKFTGAVVGMIEQFSDAFKDMMENIAKLALGMGNKWLGEIIRNFLAKLGAGGATAQAMDGSARRYQTSPWERMGLVLGQGPSGNHARETANNTRRMVALLQKLADGTGLRALGNPSMTRTMNASNP